MTRKANKPTLDTGKPNICWKERISSSSSRSLLSSRVRAYVTANDGPLRAFFPTALSLRAALYYSTMNCHKMRRGKLYKSQNHRLSPWTQWLWWLVRKGESKSCTSSSGSIFNMPWPHWMRVQISWSFMTTKLMFHTYDFVQVHPRRGHVLCYNKVIETFWNFLVWYQKINNKFLKLFLI